MLCLCFPSPVDISLEDDDDPLESIDENWGVPEASAPSVATHVAPTRPRRRSTRYGKKRR